MEPLLTHGQVPLLIVDVVGQAREGVAQVAALSACPLFHQVHLFRPSFRHFTLVVIAPLVVVLPPWIEPPAAVVAAAVSLVLVEFCILKGGGGGEQVSQQQTKKSKSACTIPIGPASITLHFVSSCFLVRLIITVKELI